MYENLLSIPWSQKSHARNRDLSESILKPTSSIRSMQLQFWYFSMVNSCCNCKICRAQCLVMIIRPIARYLQLSKTQFANKWSGCSHKMSPPECMLRNFSLATKCGLNKDSLLGEETDYWSFPALDSFSTAEENNTRLFSLEISFKVTNKSGLKAWISLRDYAFYTSCHPPELVYTWPRYDWGCTRSALCTV